jgi:magnesium-transporting ATPase (P-type)
MTAATPKPRSAVWHDRPLTDVTRAPETGPDGLTEAQDRLARFGPNRIEVEVGSSALAIIFRQIRSPLVLVLVATGAFTLAISETTDAVVILIVVVLNTAIGFVQERQAERSVLP